VYTAGLPEAQQIFDELILAWLDEFRKIRETLLNLGKKHIKHKLGLCVHFDNEHHTASSPSLAVSIRLG
jgi:hypothetical protein